MAWLAGPDLRVCMRVLSFFPCLLLLLKTIQTLFHVLAAVNIRATKSAGLSTNRQGSSVCVFSCTNEESSDVIRCHSDVQCTCHLQLWLLQRPGARVGPGPATRTGSRTFRFVAVVVLTQ